MYTNVRTREPQPELETYPLKILDLGDWFKDPSSGKIYKYIGEDTDDPETDDLVGLAPDGKRLSIFKRDKEVAPIYELSITYAVNYYDN